MIKEGKILYVNDWYTIYYTMCIEKKTQPISKILYIKNKIYVDFFFQNEN